MAEGFVALGGNWHDFWDMTPRAYMAAARGLERRRDVEVQRDRVLQQELAHLIGFAFHEPKKMPDLTKGRDASGAPAKMTESEAAAALSAAFQGLKAAQEQKGKVIRCRR